MKPLITLDRFENPVEHETPAVEMACRMDTPAGSETDTNTMESNVTETMMVFFDAAAEINEGDHINDIKDAGGAVIAENLDVVYVQRINGYFGTKHHTEVKVQQFRDRERFPL